MDDDDMPPPLEDMTDQLEAMHLIREAVGGAEVPLPDSDDVSWGDMKAAAAAAEDTVRRQAVQLPRLPTPTPYTRPPASPRGPLC